MRESNFRGKPAQEQAPLVCEEDVFHSLADKIGTALFLGKYSPTEVMAVLGKRNFFHEARKRELWPLCYDLDSWEFPVQRLRIYSQEKRTEKIIVDLKVREGLYWPKGKIVEGHAFSDYRCLILEWLTLQNPRLAFSSRRPALPGQAYPGLGLGKKVVDIFIYLARLRRLDAILAFPAYFHNAVLFSRYFRFLNPAKEGEVLAILKSVSGVPLKQLAWVIHLGCLKKEGGEAYEWRSEEQVHALDKSLKAYFASRRYREAVKRGLKSASFEIDWGAYERKIKSAAVTGL